MYLFGYHDFAWTVCGMDRIDHDRMSYGAIIMDMLAWIKAARNFYGPLEMEKTLNFDFMVMWFEMAMYRI